MVPSDSNRSVGAVQREGTLCKPQSSLIGVAIREQSMWNSPLQAPQDKEKCLQSPQRSPSYPGAWALLLEEILLTKQFTTVCAF